MTKRQMKVKQAGNDVLNTLEVFGIESPNFVKAAKHYISQEKRYTSGCCLKVFNDRLELHQGYSYCGEPDTVQDCRHNSLYQK